MTTNITVEAHCDPENEEVVVVKHHDGQAEPLLNDRLQDGEKGEYFVTDGEVISVFEDKKKDQG